MTDLALVWLGVDWSVVLLAIVIGFTVPWLVR